MEGQSTLVCLGLLVVASTAWAQIVDPRGARPIEHGYKADKCVSQKEWPFCTDDNWGPKCPSGCRLQGLIDQSDHQLLKRIERIRQLLDEHRAKYRNTDTVSKQTYDYIKDKLTLEANSDNSYYDLAQNLRQRIVDMKIKIDSNTRILNSLKSRVQDQVVEMQRLEVDIDIKLRSCKGSCKSYAEFSVNHESYVILDKQVNQLTSQAVQNVESMGTMSVMKSRPLKDVIVDSKFKSRPQQDLFSEVRAVKLTLEAEGSSASSPATVRKEVPGILSPSTSSSSSSSSSFSSSSSSSGIKGGSGSNDRPSITSLTRGDADGFFDGMGGGGLGEYALNTKSVSCTKTVRKTVVHGKDGPVEKTEEVMVGGPECASAGTTSTKGGVGSLFPSLTSGSSSSSSTSSVSTSSSSFKTSASATKGGSASILGDSTNGDAFGLDLGAFLTDDGEDDVPDFHARSVKSVHVERKADYVGKDCADIQQKHLNGEKNGLFKVKPGGLESSLVVEVYCHQGGLLGGWLLVQQRDSGALSFNRSWVEYRHGFGSVDARGNGEVWLGNHNLHLLTNQGETMLRVELEDWEGGVAYAEYTVRVGSEVEGFPLTASGYEGDAGDALVAGATGSLGSFLTHGGMKFSTYDRDSDRWEENCAEVYGGGWWYNNCQSANLNGLYYRGGKYDPGTSSHAIENGVVWMTYKPDDYSLKKVRMMIRPTAF